MDTQSNDELIRENGWVIDPTTGEVVGVYGWLENGVVESEQDLWILQKKMLDVDSSKRCVRSASRHWSHDAAGWN